ncbi:MAG: 3-dehydroquinate synthase [Terriglobia bacterium]
MSERTVRVPVGEGYLIHVGSGNLGTVGQKLAAQDQRTVVVISNASIIKLYGETVESSLREAGLLYHILEVPEGESSKSLAVVGDVHERLAGLDVRRGSLIVALGGGVIGDLAGFVAATYMRGLPFVQVPTTLVAQTDSSVGGKVGVNLKAGKNLVGSFYQPRFVLIDVDTLASLPVREVRAGLAEVIKYGFIRDKGFLSYVDKNVGRMFEGDGGVLAKVIVRCCELKAEIVGMDEKDLGERRVLNYGHTLGHAFEALTGYTRYLHGEAVSIGMVGASLIARKLGIASPELVDRHIDILKKAGLPVEAPQVSVAQVIDVCRLDKKNWGGEMIFVLLKGVAQPEVVKLTDQDLAAALDGFLGS